ncbi:hypothetical protein LshimejAT787_1002240 [Lyophyllum shimeji]|uniref:Uncharacterized protein n=1 Tax=Lyophyllum shimeji TaxID=47721 RepID=A0A9P3PU82_LYOSH|nr:hypothetical protein LshimejAT787_1002240 [Lyophyllum shimeji]
MYSTRRTPGSHPLIPPDPALSPPASVLPPPASVLVPPGSPFLHRRIPDSRFIVAPRAPHITIQFLQGLLRLVLFGSPLASFVITEHADKPHARIWCNQAIRGDLNWAADHMESSSGIHLLRAQLWDPSEADFTIFCDASLTGMGYWYPCSCVGFRSDIPPDTPSDKIFFYESLCVACAILDAAEYARCPCRLVVYTDNTNTVAMFSSLKALPAFNPLLRAVADALMRGEHQLRVLHIPGEDNTIADMLSRNRIDDAVKLVPDLQVIPFQPPQELLGATQK